MNFPPREPSTTIYYTLDGSEPTRNSPVYIAPILIESRLNEPNQLSNIKEISGYWKKPQGEVFKATVVRAKVIHDRDNTGSISITGTYFVGEEILSHYSLPVVSLTTNAGYFFDYQDGIYVKGAIYDKNYDPAIKNLANYDANYYQKGKQWERPVHIEIFEPGDLLGLSQNGAIRLHGHATRVLPEKSLRIYATSEYDPKDIFEYELFPGLTNRIDGQSIQQFDNFILRNSGNDWDHAFLRDALMQSLVSHTSLDTQAYRPVIVFLNGEYWGIHDLRQRLDEYYLASTYQVDPGQVVILESDQQIFHGNPGDEDHYTAMLEFIKENHLEDDENYETIQTFIDVENFTDYLISEIFYANTDWPHNNVRYWRLKTDGYEPGSPPGHDGRWRWMLFDLDLGFGLYPHEDGF